MGTPESYEKPVPVPQTHTRTKDKMTIFSNKRRFELLSVITLLFGHIHNCIFALVTPVQYHHSRSTVTPLFVSANKHIHDNQNNNMPTNSAVVKESTQRQLAGKTVFLTGATGGLGTALSLQLARCDLKRLIISGRKMDLLQRVKEQCLQAAVDSRNNIHEMDVHVLVCDLNDPAQVKDTAKEVVKLGPVDVLINNGGLSSRSPFLETALSVDERVSRQNMYPANMHTAPKKRKHGVCVCVCLFVCLYVRVR